MMELIVSKQLLLICLKRKGKCKFGIGNFNKINTSIVGFRGIFFLNSPVALNIEPATFLMVTINRHCISVNNRVVKY